ncbi:MAG TPA: SusC/RagA family TonB-linked outer membrane protein [Chitinophagaceae bacterium]|nr:SusC/RagA family TonB-linked outer membrane protein [Chitinophagaceae bacterium]
MRFCLSWLLLLTAVFTSNAQKIPVKGVITDVNSKPLHGATILAKGTRLATTSNEDGSFLLNVTSLDNLVLLVTYTGFASREIKVNGTDAIKISLAPADNTLTDVIVVSALGLTRKAKSVPYSSQSIDPTALTEARDANITNLLAGKVAGIQVTTTGQPGSSTRVILRGENSLTNNNQPLWVVDGIPISNNMGDNTTSNLDYGNGAQDLNPDDIESIEVLKGPNAAALYGSQAANGAILITTKKAKIGDKTFGIALNQNYMKYSVTQWPDYQNVYGEGGNGRLVTNANAIVPGTNAINMGTSYQSWGMPMLGQPYNTYSGKPHGYLPQGNNMKDFFQSPFINATNLSIAKADANSAFRVSYTFTKANDVVDNLNLKNKHNLNITASRKLGSLVTVDARLIYTNDAVNNRMDRNISPGNPLSLFIWQARSVDITTLNPYKDANGNSLQLNAITDSENPYWSIYANSNADQHNRILGGPVVTVNIAKGITAKAQVSADLNFARSNVYKELGGKQVPKGFYSNLMQDEKTWTYEGQLILNKRIGSDFTLNGVGGVNFTNLNNFSRGASVNSLLVHEMPSIGNANVTPQAFETNTRRKVFSVLASATIGFRDFLFVDITGRNEWSSTLPAGKNNYFYPSFGGSFVFSQFIPKTSILNYGKLRGSWARVGNSPSPYSLVNTYSTPQFFAGNPYQFFTNSLKNPDLKPEITVSKEIGIDLGFFANRITLSASVYKGNTTNQIIIANTPQETGFNSRIINAGEIQNKGLEITLGGSPVKTKKFNWNVNVNYSVNKNLVVSLIPGLPRISLGNNLGVTIYAEAGMPYGTMRGNAPYKVGDTIIVGTNGRNIADANVLTGNYRPDWIGSVENSFRYGQFDFSVLLTLKMGGNIYSASYGRAMFAGTTIQSLAGRDDYLMSAFVLGESDDERRNLGQIVGVSRTRYQDSMRVKGLAYPNAYLAKLDANGNQVIGKNGRIVPGDKFYGWVYPQLVNGNDKVLNDVPSLTYDATSIKIAEMRFGYTLPTKLVNKARIQSARIAFVGRNLWQILQRTPLGIDPESASNTGNAQGIDAAGSYPYAQWGFDLKLTF